ncbi:MAG: alcohol dehydrogenase catalytic domain-containing protein [Chloracidobacterium sp.]|nr:alcohol dehydrogenase catalytic domain-containing protein [Chloracidobacterium sp.]
MKALRIEDNKLKLADLALPRRDGEALIRMTMAGICNTDLEIARGYVDFHGTLGHEFVGVVEESPDRSQIGRRVVGEINVGCGRCDLCRANDPRHCPDRAALGIRGRDGAFAEYLSLPPRNLLLVPDSVNDRHAVFTEPLAAALEILDQVEIRASDRVAVLGDGKLGQLISRVIARTGCDLTLIGKHDSKLELAARAGVKTSKLALCSDGLSRPVAKAVTTKGSQFDFVIEASGSPDGLGLALDLIRPRGAIILKSTFRGEVRIDTSRVVVNEVSVTGSRCGRFEPALRLLESGELDLAPLVAGEYQLSGGLEAMAEAARPGTLKVLLKN